MKFNKKIIAFILILAANILYSQTGSQVSWVTSSSMNDTALVEKLLKTALKYNPNVKISRNNIEIANKDLTIKKLSWLNALSISYSFNPGFLNNSGVLNNDMKAGIVIGLNVGSLLAVPFETGKASVNVEIQENVLEAQKLALYEEITTKLNAFITAGHKITENTGRLDNAQNNLTLIKYRFEKGELELNTYNEALDKYSDSYLDKIKAEAEYFSAKASLEAVVGKKLEEIK